ncbi:MAG: hypothetical protein CL943_03005 [Candidatus Diapherotrites archaeon]|uniref:Homoserine O-acetyltransferase n=1 Tax=Candidatus Iainarchaeum sp. TaxID=3101447 RepID=A0A2D6M1E2_9ARCH|nr:hypothetical protein [Candidatus Diapherotrites archaeon]
MSKAIDTFDLEKEFGSIENAFANTKARIQFISISSDQLFLPEQTKKLHKILLACGVDSNYSEIDSLKGHDGLFIEDDKTSKIIGEKLK